MKHFFCLMLLAGLGLSIPSLAADPAVTKKQAVCGETTEYKGTWVVGEDRDNNMFNASWFRLDAGKSVLCITAVTGGEEKMLFKNTYLTAAKIKFLAGNCNFDGGTDRYVLAEVVDDGAPTAPAFKAWRFDVKEKRLKYETASKVECVIN